MKWVMLSVALVISGGPLLAQQQRSSVSMIELIANSEEYHGQQVLVSGFMYLQFEGTALWFHQQDLEYGRHKNSLWLDFTNSEVTSDINCRYVQVVGTFNSEMLGHMGLSSGAIQNISHLQPLKRRRGPAAPEPSCEPAGRD